METKNIYLQVDIWELTDILVENLILIYSENNLDLVCDDDIKKNTEIIFKEILDNRMDEIIKGLR